jgi:hypothetical protein
MCGQTPFKNTGYQRWDLWLIFIHLNTLHMFIYLGMHG